MKATPSAAPLPPALPAWHTPFARVQLYATGMGVVLSLVGAYALDDDPFALRTLYVLALCWLGGALDFAAYRLASRLAWSKPQAWRRVLVATAIVVVPLGLLIWGSTWLVGRNMAPSMLQVVFANTFIITGAFMGAFVAPTVDMAAKRAEADALAVETANSSTPPANFMERLPRHLRDAQLWALKAEDHYLLALTSKGEGLIRLRLADALLELPAEQGAQTHRSWWVARQAVAGVRKGEGKVALLLPDGREVAVSRAFAKPLRDAGWY